MENARPAAPVEPLVLRSSRVTCTLYCGDCLELLPIEADAIVTDPPYGIGVTRMTLGNGLRRVDRGRSEWDERPPELGWIWEFGKPAAVWGANHFNPPPSRKWLVWDKGTGDNDFADCELAWTNMEGAIRKRFHSWVGANAKERDEKDRYHPTQKPVAIMAWAMEQIEIAEGAIVFDPYMGSGTTGVACIRTGRNFIGVEKDETYFKIAADRLRREMRVGRMF